MDLVIRNARIHTVDPALPRAEAVAVRGGRIAWVGADRDAPDAAEVVDAGGATVLPGFVDAHNHVRLGSDAAGAQLAGAASLDEVGRRIAAWGAANPDAEWIEAEGLDYTALPNHSGSAADLDGLTDGRPAAVLSYDVHSLWLNTAALERLGVDRHHTSLPFGVAVVQDGEPTGFVHDFAVRGLSRDGLAALRDLGLPWARLDRQYARLVESLDLAARSGITTVVEPQNSVDDLALFLRARDEGRLRSRLVAALFHPRGTTAAQLQEFAELARTYDDDVVRVGPLKLYIDDVVEPRTAAMLEPYEGEPANVGRTYYEPDEFAEVVTRLDAARFQLFVHATGDRGIRTVLDAIQEARRRNGPRDSRHQVVHVECLDPADVHRFAELGVVACMQPRHCSPDIAGPGHDWAEAVGERRWGKAWPMRSLHEAGATLAFSSDWNVAEMDPLLGIYSAVTRQGLAGGPAWMPEQTVDLATAVHAYTWGSAFANFCEGDRGTVTVGKHADLVLLSHDLFATPVGRIPEVAVDLTLTNGAVVHRR
jgi:predicted amidohydrolase YtcJ